MGSQLLATKMSRKIESKQGKSCPARLNLTAPPSGYCITVSLTRGSDGSNYGGLLTNTYANKKGGAPDKAWMSVLGVNGGLIGPHGLFFFSAIQLK